jgi:hypothetical protein
MVQPPESTLGWRRDRNTAEVIAGRRSKLEVHRALWVRLGTIAFRPTLGDGKK